MEDMVGSSNTLSASKAATWEHDAPYGFDLLKCTSPKESFSSHLHQTKVLRCTQLDALPALKLRPAAL